MPFQPVPAVAEARMFFRLHGQVVTKTVAVISADPWTADLLNQLIDVLEAWHNDTLSPLHSVNVSLFHIAARSLAEEDGVATERAITVNGEGAIANPALPGNVCLAIKLTGGLAGRNRRGRTYHFGIPENAQEGNEVTLAYRDQVVAAYLQLRDDLTAAGFSWVVISRYNGVNPDGTPIKRAAGLPTIITGCSGDVYLDSQRRRLSGRGA
ncbi:MAG TPA: hypothetical protein VFG99_13210 [Chloroflexia bacterium]|nr:hypothetical protein [Chloroflexia bacterium]